MYPQAQVQYIVRSRNAQRMSDQSDQFVLRPVPTLFSISKVLSSHWPRNRDQGTLQPPLCPIYRPSGPSSCQKQSIMCPDLLPIITTSAAESATKYRMCAFSALLSLFVLAL